MAGAVLIGRRLLCDTDSGSGRSLIVLGISDDVSALLNLRGVDCAMGGGVGIAERVLPLRVAPAAGVRLG